MDMPPVCGDIQPMKADIKRFERDAQVRNRRYYLVPASRAAGKSAVVAISGHPERQQKTASSQRSASMRFL
jgi:hypothetical protein